MESQKNIKLTRKEKKALKKQNKNNSDKKGVLLIIALAVVALVLLVNAVSVYNQEPEPADLVIKVNLPNGVVQTQPTVLPTVEPTQKPDIPTKEDDATKPEEPTAKGEMSKQEILQKVTDGVNSIKSETATYSAVRTQVISLDLKECSLPAFVGIVNTVMDLFEGETITEYSFTNGKGTDSGSGEEITAIASIPPSSELFRLTSDGVAEATIEKDGENTVYTVVVVPETSTMDNPRPTHHHSAGDTFDVRKVELPFGAITKADFDYPGSAVSVTVAPDGKVVRYQQKLKVNGVGEGAAMGLSASGRIEGQVVEIWEITY